jgi:copper chaperone
MEKQTLSVPNISCGHCVMAIQNGLKEMGGVLSVKGDPEEKRITVTWDAPATLDAIHSKLREINYPASP